MKKKKKKKKKKKENLSLEWFLHEVPLSHHTGSRYLKRAAGLSTRQKRKAVKLFQKMI